MSNASDYWRSRSEALAQRQYDKADTYEDVQRREYGKASAEIQRSVEVFYHRYAINNQVTLAEAKKMLTAKEHKQFKMSLEEFTAKAKDNADGRWTQQLNNVYYKTRVSRLEALNTEIRQQVELLAGSRQKGTSELLADVYKDSYHHTLYDLQKGTGIGVSFTKINDEGMDKVLNTSWAGSKFSKRIWGDRDKLTAELQTKLTQSFIRGDSSEKTIKDLMERMDVSRSKAERLVQTESAFFTHQATAAAYKSNGVKKYEVLATLDKRTSQICRGMDRKVFDLSDMAVSVNYPPFHARCRTTVMPYFDDEINVGERIARDEKGGTYHVPGDISYADWEKKYATPKVDSTKVPESGIISPPTYRTFKNVDEVKEWEEKVTPKWLNALTGNEESAVTKYTGGAYKDINKQLRSGETSDYYRTIIDRISSALNKFELTDDIVAFRGVDRKIFGDNPTEMVGGIFTDWGFTSTSLLADRSFNGSAKIEIRVPVNSKGAFINPISDFEDNEFEFLLDRGTNFLILDAYEENNVLHLVMEVVLDEGI